MLAAVLEIALYPSFSHIISANLPASGHAGVYAVSVTQHDDFTIGAYEIAPVGVDRSHYAIVDGGGTIPGRNSFSRKSVILLV